MDTMDNLKDEYAATVVKLDDLDGRLQEKFAKGADEQPPSLIWSESNADVEDDAVNDAIAAGSEDGEQHAAAQYGPMTAAEALMSKLRIAMADDVPWPSSRRTANAACRCRSSSATHDIRKPSRWRTVRRRVISPPLRSQRATQESAVDVEPSAASRLSSDWRARLAQGSRHVSTCILRAAMLV